MLNQEEIQLFENFFNCRSKYKARCAKYATADKKIDNEKASQDPLIKVLQEQMYKSRDALRNIDYISVRIKEGCDISELKNYPYLKDNSLNADKNEFYIIKNSDSFEKMMENNPDIELS